MFAGSLRLSRLPVQLPKMELILPLLKKTLLAAAACLAIAPMAAAAPSTPAPSAQSLYGDLKWREVGPFRGGWGEMVVGVPDQPDTFLFGAAGGGVWRTDDAGRTWRGLFQNGPASPVAAIAIAPSDARVIYIGTGQVEPRYDVQAGMGVFRSDDGGQTWRPLGLQDTRYIGRIWVDPRNPDVVLVGAMGHFFGPNAERGVFRSTDGGRTWTHALKIDDETGVADIAADPSDPSVLYAAAWQVRQYPWQSYFTPASGPGSAVYRSTDGGATWSKINGEGWPTGPLGRISLATTRTPAGLRIYATVDSATAPGLYRSDDGGAHWIRANPNPVITNYYASRIVVAPNDPDVVFTVGQSIRRCTDAGRTCTIFKGAPGGDDYHHVWINPAHPDHIATASDQGTVISVDGGRTWSSWYNQPTAQLYHVATDNRFPYWIYSGQQDSGTVGIASRSDYGSITFRDWHPVGGDERAYDIPDPNDPMIVYGSGLGGHVSRYDARTGQVEDISAWPVSSYGARPTTVKHHYNWVTPLVTSRTGPTTLFLGAEVVFASKDGGHHWSTISPDLVGRREDAKDCGGSPGLDQAFACGYGTITQIAPSPRHADELWVGTDSGLIQVTRDGGGHWSEVTPPAISHWSRIASIDVSPDADGLAYVVVDRQRLDDFQPHVLQTRDYGRSWRDISSNLPRDHVASVVRVDPVKPGLLYAGTDNGALVSFDDGGHWNSLQQNLPSAWVRDLNVHGDDLVIASQGRGVWILDDVTPLRQIGTQDSRRAPRLFAPAVALRVHPNNNKDTPLPPEEPVGQNPPAGVAIDYWLPTDERKPVEIDILDTSGTLVNRMTSAPQPRAKAEQYFADIWVRPDAGLSTRAGMHRAFWNVRWARPQAIAYEYSIAAVYGEDTPSSPEGPFAVPGDYTAVLKLGGREVGRQPLRVALDPRISTSQADLSASLAFSQQIDGLLPQLRRAYGERSAAERQLTDLEKRLKAGGKVQLAERVNALNSRVKAPDAPDFAKLSGLLAALEGGQESADAAPTAAQRQVFDETAEKARAGLAWWASLRDGDVKSLDPDLRKAGQKPPSYPRADELTIDAPEGGQELP